VARKITLEIRGEGHIKQKVRGSQRGGAHSRGQRKSEGRGTPSRGQRKSEGRERWHTKQMEVRGEGHTKQMEVRGEGHTKGEKVRGSSRGSLMQLLISSQVLQ
jgi:hypothetical protein